MRWLSVFFAPGLRHGAGIKSIKIETDTYTHCVDLNWSWAAPVVLRSDVIDLFSGLIDRCVMDPDCDCNQIHSPNFIAPLPQLRFENLKFGSDTEFGCFVSLKLTKGEVSQLFTPPDQKKIDASLEDVFLPLNNLTTYLKVMAQQVDYDGPSQALALTAERLDEFLLLYGERLQDADHSAPYRGHVVP